jgi:hypothetical protein
LSESVRIFGTPSKDWWNDDTTDHQMTPIDAVRLQAMACVRLDDGAWWDDE